MIELKTIRQSVRGRRETIRGLIFRLFLLWAKSNLERKVEGDFDPVASRKLDCIVFLLEN